MCVLRKAENRDMSYEKHLSMPLDVEGKAVPLQAWSGPEGFRKLRFPDFMTTAQDGGKFVSLYWYSFLLEAESTPGP